jgi:hypothetical protein
LEYEGADVIGLVSAVTTATGYNKQVNRQHKDFAFESNKRIRADAAVVEYRTHLLALFISVANRAITRSGVVVADIDGKSAPSAIKAPSDEAGGTDFDH